MKKITLFMALLMWSSYFYGQTYVEEGFESGVPGGWINVAGATDVLGETWESNSVTANSGTKCVYFKDTGEQTISAGSFVNGILYKINSLGNTDWVAIGWISSGPSNPIPAVGDTFTATGAGTGTGTATTSAIGDRWLISPSMDFTSATIPELTYSEAVRFPDFPATIKVYYSTNYTGGAPGGAAWTELNSTFGFSNGEPEYTWKIRGAFDLTAANGNSNVRVAFQYVGTAGSRWYLDDILVREQPSCVEPSSGSISSITTTSAQFSWTSGPGGTETSWDVELVDITGGETQGTGTTTNGVSSPHAFNSLTPGNSYEAYVRADCDNAPGGDDSLWSGPFAFVTVSSNDDCSGAVTIIQEVEIATRDFATAYNGTVDSATDSGVVDGCGSGGDPNDDVWYSFVARTDGVNITLDDLNYDGVLELYEGSCGSLVYKSCSDVNAVGPAREEIIASGLSIGTTYYARVFNWDTAAPANGNFTLKIWSSEALSTEDTKLTEFKLYPNPVSDKLNLRAQDNIENISVYNMLGQEVLRNIPNRNSAEVNVSQLQTGAYFVKVTINGITETKRIIKR